VGSTTLIARQGLAPLLAVMLAAVLVLHFVGFGASIGLWVCAVLVFLLFRDPERIIPSLPLSVLSPADGRVRQIGKTHDPYLNRESLRITIDMSPFGAYITRSPVEGKVLDPPRRVGGGQDPHGVWLQTDEGDDIVLVMNKGRLRNNPQCDVRYGDRIGQGKRCGFVHLGGRIDMYLPMNSVAVTAVGKPVHAGSDVVARLVHG
jgi:phosphatidylserine decarboxylase